MLNREQETEELKYMAYDNSISIISMDDILEAYQHFEASEEVKESILDFISDLTGKSVDALAEMLENSK